jgi:hypothetical protein
MGAALAAGVLAAWSTTHVVAGLLEMSAGASLALTAIAVALTVVSFPVWFSLAMLHSASLSARWRRPRVRRALSKMADELGAHAGTIVAEHWSGDGVIAGPFSLADTAVVSPTASRTRLAPRPLVNSRTCSRQSASS